MITPSATYRIQFNNQFTFKQLQPVIPYLHKLSITAIYASPILTAIQDSSHGYDVCDYETISESIGTLNGLEQLHKNLEEKGMGWIQDIVPNHMALVTSNLLVWDILQRGRESAYADFFDINWQHESFTNKMMLPVLECSAADGIKQKKLQLALTGKGLVVKYYSNEYPLAISSYPALFETEYLNKNFKNELLQLQQNHSSSFKKWSNLQQKFNSRLNKPKNRKCIEAILASLNNDGALLENVINNQHYCFGAYYDTNSHINYRRFFNINTLIGVRMEDEKVFDDYHCFIQKLYKKKLLHGLRIDHIDGLKNPVDYFEKMRATFGKDCYIVAEKILAHGEELPAKMNIQGTTGYDFLAMINRLLTHEDGGKKLAHFYHKLSPENSNYTRLVFDKKWSYLSNYLNGEWENMVQLFSKTITVKPAIKKEVLKEALGVFMSSFSVYRIYAENLPLDAMANKILAQALAQAVTLKPTLKAAFKAIEKLFAPGGDEVAKLHCIQKMMQLVSPLTAKGVEDTTFYNYNALISHNEVGDDPAVLSGSIDEFHAAMQQRQANMPLTQNTTSTHDTKRGEDARARINVLAEMADDWLALVKQLDEAATPFLKKNIPSRNEVYMLYQSLVGSFPENGKVEKDFIQRTQDFFQKSLREASLHTSHYNNNTAYEEACMIFIEHLLTSKAFLKLFTPFIKQVLQYANVYSLAQVVIKVTSPGIPDFYQGNELFNTCYVDPDNRRQVDYKHAIEMLKSIETFNKKQRPQLLQLLEEQKISGIQKLFVTKEVLALRKRLNHLFITGNYMPVTIYQQSKIAFAYCRHFQGKWVLVIAPLALVGNKKELTNIVLQLPKQAPTKWVNIFTLEKLTIKESVAGDVFAHFPVAVFESA